jgi:hypothetical protein
MLEDEEFIRLSKRVNRGDGWKRDGSPSEKTGRHDARMRSSFGFANYPLYSDHFSQPTPTQILVPSLLQATFSSPVPPLPFGPSLSSVPAHIGERRGSNEPSACSASSQPSAHPPIEHSLVQPSQQPRHSAAPIPANAQLPQSIHLHLPSSKLPSQPFDFGIWSETTLPHHIPALASASVTASTSAAPKPPSPKQMGQHSDWDLPLGAYSALSAPEKKKAQNVFASKVLGGRRRKSSGYWRAG